MPLGKIVEAGMKAKKMYDENKQKPKKMVSDPEIPVPGRKRGAPQVTNQSRAEAAAKAFKVPGSDTVIKAREKRERMLRDL